MRADPFVLVFISLYLLLGIFGESQRSGKTVHVTVQSESIKKSRSCHLPRDLHLSIHGHNVSITLYLHRKYRHDVKIPVSVMDVSQNGKTLPRFWKHIHPNGKYYEDLYHSVLLEITCSLTKLTRRQYFARGFISVHGQTYVLRPVTDHRVQRQPNRNVHQIEVMSRDNNHHGKIVYEPRQYHRPHKRKAVPEYKIDVVVLVDWKLYDHWVSLVDGSTRAERETNAKLSIPQYIALVFEGVNTRYASIPDYRVTVNIVDIIIFENRNGNHVTPVNSPLELLEANKTLHDLRTYVSSNGLSGNDHVMLFTGYDIASTDSGVLFKYTTGQAFVGTMCEKDGRSVSIVEDHAGFQSVHTATHELAHSLNATHDGIQNLCRLQDRYIMAGGPSDMTETNKANPWIFSSCSIQEMASFFTEKVNTPAGMTCLQQSLPVTGTIPDVSQQKAGQLYSPDELCQHIYGQMSYYCRGQGNVSDICHSMYCRSDTSVLGPVSCNEHHAADYTSCGDRMWCSGGKCILSEDAPPKDAKCVHGDEPSRQINGKTCADLLAGADYFCYEDITQTHCCDTCKKRFTGTDGCEYGDKLQGCDPSFCTTIYPNGTIQDSTCCGTCQFRPREWLCEDNSRTPGLDCSTVKGHHCYNWTVAFYCCATCSNIRHPETPGCEYGDKTDNCPALTNNGRRCDSEIEPFCCKTCSTTSSAHDSVTSSMSFVLLLFIASVVLARLQTLP